MQYTDCSPFRVMLKRVFSSGRERTGTKSLVERPSGLLVFCFGAIGTCSQTRRKNRPSGSVIVNRLLQVGSLEYFFPIYSRHGVFTDQFVF